MNETAGHTFNIAQTTRLSRASRFRIRFGRPVETASRILALAPGPTSAPSSTVTTGWSLLLPARRRSRVPCLPTSPLAKQGHAHECPRGRKRAEKDTVYVELSLEKGTTMNSVIKPGEAFTLKDLIPYQDGRIVNMDLAHNDSMKFVLMSFDAGTGLSEHAAPRRCPSCLRWTARQPSPTRASRTSSVPDRPSSLMRAAVTPCAPTSALRWRCWSRWRRAIRQVTSG